MPQDGAMTGEFKQQLSNDAEFILKQHPISKDELIDWDELERLPFQEFEAKVADEFLMRLIIDETSQVAEKYTRVGLEKRDPGKDRVYGSPDDTYMKAGQDAAGKQLALAAWRMSRLLNIFGKQLIQNDRFDIVDYNLFNMGETADQLN